jgi:hypothetical protein
MRAGRSSSRSTLRFGGAELPFRPYRAVVWREADVHFVEMREHLIAYPMPGFFGNLSRGFYIVAGVR